MDLFDIVAGIILTVIGGKGVWWIIGIILSGASTGNWLMVIAGGIMGCLFFGLFFVAFLGGLALLTEGLLG